MKQGYMIAIFFMAILSIFVYGGYVKDERYITDTIVLNDSPEECISVFPAGVEVEYKRLVQRTQIYKDADIQKEKWGGYSKGVNIKKVCGNQIYGQIVFVTTNHRDPNNKQYLNFNVTVIRR